jgi:hypothetical protein
MLRNAKLEALVDLSNVAAGISSNISLLRAFMQDTNSAAHRPSRHKLELGLAEYLPDSRVPLWIPTEKGKQLNEITEKFRNAAIELDGFITGLYEEGPK